MLLEKKVLCQAISALIATLGAMAMGTILGWTSPAQTMLPKTASFPVTENDATIYGSVFGIGAAIGSIPSGIVSNLIGRRFGMVLFEMTVVVGWALLLQPKALWMLHCGRFLQGVGIGALCTIIPTYVGEISEPHIRGSLGSLFQVFVVIGILYSFVVSTMTNYLIFNSLCGIWAVMHVLGAFFIPESPYYLLSKDDNDKAKDSMMKLRNGNEEGVNSEITLLKNEIQAQKSNQKTLGQLFSDKANRKALFIGIGCMFFQQTSGINVIIFYMNYIFKITNSTITPNTASITVGFVQLIMTFVTMAIIDKVGRRVLLIISAVTMGLCFAGLAGYFVILESKIMDAKTIGMLPLFLIALYIAAFSLGFGPIPWVLMGEIFSNEIKPFGTSLAAFTNWILVFVVTFLSTTITNAIGIRGLFATYCIFCLLGAGFVWVFVPETKNKSLAEIQAKLAGTEVGAASAPAPAPAPAPDSGA